MNEVFTRTKKSFFKKFTYNPVSLILVGAIWLLMTQFRMDALRGRICDLFFLTNPKVKKDPSIVLIAYDDISQYRYPGEKGFPLVELNQVLDFLNKAKPKAIGILLRELDHYSYDEFSSLLERVKQTPNAFIGYLDPQNSVRSLPGFAQQENIFFPGYISKDSVNFGADSVSRRIMLDIEGFQTVYDRIAEVTTDKKIYERIQANAYKGSKFAFIYWQGKSVEYPLYSTRDVVESAVTKEELTDKVVLIGTVLKQYADQDYTFSPYSRKAKETTSLEAAAQGLASLRMGTSLVACPEWFYHLLALVLGVLVCITILSFPPYLGVIILLSAVFVLGVLSWILFHFFYFWLPLVHPILLMVASYYLALPTRLLTEYQSRWHYQEEAEMMSEVQKLKNNFLSLISHDLKTPLARMQGSVELVLEKGQKLNEIERRSLFGMLHTIQDMTEYVQSLLDVSRMDAQQIPFEKVSRDLNITIEEAIRDKKHLAEEKNISLEVDLEPMFSVKHDPMLMRRALANLIENAIKYSPVQTKVSVRSRDVKDWIEVQIQDQGYGIALEDQPKIFDKFYRGSSEITSSIKGTGLGLYLVKYFIELHQGRVLLESTPSKGTIFKVQVPVK